MKFEVGPCKYKGRGKTHWAKLTLFSVGYSHPAKLVFTDEEIRWGDLAIYFASEERHQEVVSKLKRGITLGDLVSLPLNTHGLKENPKITRMAIMTPALYEDKPGILYIAEENDLIDNTDQNVFVVGFFDNKVMGGLAKDSNGKMYRTSKLLKHSNTVRPYLSYPTGQITAGRLAIKGSCTIQKSIPDTDEYARVVLERHTKDLILEEHSTTE